MIKPRIWSLVLLFLLAGALLVLPARANPARSTDGTPAAAPPPRLFWYISPLTKQPSTQYINSVAFDPTNPGVALAAEGNSGGMLLRTTDHGLTWAPLTNWNPNYIIYPFQVIYGESPNMYYAWGGTRIYKTSDSGDTWTPIPYNTLCNVIDTLAVHPADPAVLYVGTRSGFARSLDGGQTWSSPNPNPCGGEPNALAIGAGVDQPNVVYAGEGTSHFGGGVYHSTDQGLTWERRSTGLPLEYSGALPPVRRLLVDPRNADIVYAQIERGHQHSRVYRTINSGATWSLLDQGIESVWLTSIVLDTAHGNAVYAASTDHVYVLEDGAQAWQRLDTEPIPQIASSPYAIKLQIDPAASQRPVAYSDYGIYIGLPIPTITKLSPATASVGMHDFTLTVEGSDFTPGARVRWNGQERPTTFVSDTRLTTVISATDVLTTGVVPITVGYHRFYEFGSDGASNALPLTIQPVCTADGQTLPSGQCAVTVTPGAASTLVYSSTASLVTSIAVPAGSVTATTVLSYTALPTANAPAGFGFAGLAWTLDASQNGAKLDGFAFTQPINVTVQYGDADIAGLNEQTLTLDYWNGTTWVDAATTCDPPSVYQREPEANRFSVAVCHLTPFGVFGVPQRKLFLPLTRR